MLPDELAAAPTLSPLPSGRFTMLRGLGWATLDQAISSCTNFAITVLAARQLSRRDFGAFGLAFLLSVIVMGVVRGAVTEPLLSRPELGAGTRRQATFEAVAAAALGLGLLAAAGIVVPAALVGGTTGRTLVALAVVLPGLCLQDAWRYCFISQGRAIAAVLNDAAWLLLQSGVVLALAVTRGLSTAGIVLAWGGAGVGAGVLGAAQAGVLPRARAGLAWLSAQRSLGARYCLEFLTASAATQFALLGLGAISGLAALGAVRGAQAFFGPLVVLFNGIFLALVPLASALRSAPSRLRRLMTLVSAAVSACALAWMLVGINLPDRLGRQLFGDTWSSAHAILFPTGLALLAGGIVAGPIAGLRSLAAARASLRARLLTAPILVVAPVVGGVIADSKGFSYGVASATFAGALVYWWQFVRASGPPLPVPDLETVPAR